MISYPEALKKILELAPRLESEELPLSESAGRVCAAEVISDQNIPAFDNSAMDGYAVVAAETSGAGTRLKVIGTLAAGAEVGSLRYEPSTACEIMTGAPIPPGFDSVIKVEDTAREGDSVLLNAAVSKGQNVRPAAEDVREGQGVLSPGRVIGTSEIMMLATLGISRLKVFRRPRVAVISTGKEIIDDPLAPLAFGQIRNSTGPALLCELRALGAEVTYHGVIADEPERFFELLAKLTPDLVVTTGAVSMGKYDFIKSCLLDAGAEIVFHKAAIRPGKPILFSKMPKGGPLVFGLPGNPVSTLVGARFFVEPLLLAMSGREQARPLRAVLVSDCRKPPGLRQFAKARVTIGKDTRLRIEVLSGQSSAMVKPLLEANAWAVLPESKDGLSAGEEVEFQPMNSYHGIFGGAL